MERNNGKSLFPNWEEFLLSAADKLDQENKTSKATIIRSLLNDTPPDYLEAAQRSYAALGPWHWNALLQEIFEIDLSQATEKSLELARLVWQLGSDLVVTTNVDLVLQSVHKFPQTIKILDAQSVEFVELQKNWKPSRPTVLYLHGHIDNKANIIFTREQYQNFYDLNKNKAKLETLKTLFTQRKILFIGFSLNDLFILRELEKVNLIYEGGANSFYALIREEEKDNPNIPNYVNKIIYSDFGDPLLTLLKEMSKISAGKNPLQLSAISEKKELRNPQPKEASKKSFDDIITDVKTEYKQGPVGWKPWGDHPLIIATILICAIIGVILGILPYCSSSIKSPENHNGSQSSTPSETIIPTDGVSGKELNEVVLGLYIDKSQSIDKSVLSNEKSKIKTMLYLLFPQSINVLKFGENDQSIWGISSIAYQVSDEQFSEIRESEQIKTCEHEIRTSLNAICVEKIRASYRNKRDEMSSAAIEGTLNVIFEQSKSQSHCTNFFELNERISKDAHKINIVITDGKDTCKQLPNIMEDRATNLKILILLVPSVGDVAGESFVKRKIHMEKIFQSHTTYVFPLVSATAKEIIQNLQN